MKQTLATLASINCLWVENSYKWLLFNTAHIDVSFAIRREKTIDCLRETSETQHLEKQSTNMGYRQTGALLRKGQRQDSLSATLLISWFQEVLLNMTFWKGTERIPLADSNWINKDFGSHRIWAVPNTAGPWFPRDISQCVNSSK